MKLGVTFPQLEIGSDPAAIRDYAQTVEGLGFDYLLAYEHVLGANPDRPGGWHGPYTHESAFHEPFVLFGFLAGQTTRLELGTNILILPQRPTVLVAKQAAQVDVLSGGRLRLGIGVGWNKVEYDALGYDFHTRGRRCEEQVALLNALWTQPLVTFQGRHENVADAGLNPMPVQRPIPIWFGGLADPVLRRMARLGAGWMPNPMPLEKSQAVVARLRDYLMEVGRPVTAFGIDVRINVRTMPDEADWLAHARAWEQLGATHLCINTMGAGYESLDEHLAAIRRFKEAMAGL